MSGEGRARTWRFGIIGGGPAGSLFAHFAFRWANSLNQPIELTIFDGKTFQKSGPHGCNLCAGVISRSLQQRLQEEGIFLPARRIMSWVDSYVLHVGLDQLHLSAPEGRPGKVATVFRGNGPRYIRFPEIVSFDDFLLSWAQDLGSKVIPYAVQNLSLPEKEGQPMRIQYGYHNSLFGETEVDWVIGAFGVNTSLGQKIRQLNIGYFPPRTRLTFQAELKFPDALREELLGNNIHIYIPRHRKIRYATLIPKGEFTTLTIIGWDDVRPGILQDFFGLEAIKKFLPPTEPTCFCYPRIVIAPCRRPHFPRFLVVGDAAFCRYYKNGLESAFLSAKMAAEAIFNPKINEKPLKAYFKIATDKIIKDNFYGRLLFHLNDFIASLPPLTRFHLNLVSRPLSDFISLNLRQILWDMFTGERPYKEIFKRLFDLRLQRRVLMALILGLWRRQNKRLPSQKLRACSENKEQKIKMKRNLLSVKKPTSGIERNDGSKSSEPPKTSSLWPEGRTNPENLISKFSLPEAPKDLTPQTSANKNFTHSLSTREAPVLDGKTIAVIGGGPAGTAFAIKLSQLSRRQNQKPRIVLYEGKPLEKKSHYNQCLGVLSPPLPSLLEKELEVPFPWTIVQKTILGYYLHTEKTTLRLDGVHEPSFACRRVEFDGYLFQKARAEGVEIINARVVDLDLLNQAIMVYSESNNLRADLVVGAFGLDDGMVKIMERLTPYRQPDFLFSVVTKFHPGIEAVNAFGQYLHAFLLRSLPGVEFAAITPKGNHLSLNIAGRKVDASSMDAFLHLPVIRKVLPPGAEKLFSSLSYYKGKFPTGPARNFLLPRVIMLGDAAGLNRPFKGKGINSAILTAVRAAEALARYGVGDRMQREFTRSCADLISDIPYGRRLRWLTIILTRLGMMDGVLNQAHNEPGLYRALFHIISGQKAYRTIWEEERNIRLLLRLALACFSGRRLLA